MAMEEILWQKESFKTKMENATRKVTNKRHMITVLTIEKIWVMIKDQTDKEHEELLKMWRFAWFWRL